MTYATFARSEAAAPAWQSRGASKAAASTLRIGDPNDAYEQEADRVADEVMTGGATKLHWSISNMKLATVQRQARGSGAQDQPAPRSNNYDEAAKKIGEAFLKTDVGKNLIDAAKQDQLVKGAEGFVGTLPGKIIAGAAAVGAVSALAATHTALPAQIPEIPLDSVRPGLSVKITYEGPVDHPTKAAITFSYSPKGEEKKPKETASERHRAETAGMAAEQEKFRAGMKYKPGSPQDIQQKLQQKAVEDYVLHRFGALPGTGGQPLIPSYPGLRELPDTGLRLPAFESPFKAKPIHVLDRQLELKPLTSANAPSEAEKKEEPTPVQRKAEGSAPELDGVAAPQIVHDVLNSPGQPLEPRARSFFEAKFGYDLSKVRLHNDATAAQSAASVSAKAYTVGTDVVFGRGTGPTNTQLLAHELAHVIQQSNMRWHGTRLHDGVGEADGIHERHADSVAERVVAGHSAAGLLASSDFTAGQEPGESGTIQRASALLPPEKVQEVYGSWVQEIFKARKTTVLTEELDREVREKVKKQVGLGNFANWEKWERELSARVEAQPDAETEPFDPQAALPGLRDRMWMATEQLRAEVARVETFAQKLNFGRGVKGAIARGVAAEYTRLWAVDARTASSVAGHVPMMALGAAGLVVGSELGERTLVEHGRAFKKEAEEVGEDVRAAARLVGGDLQATYEATRPSYNRYQKAYRDFSDARIKFNKDLEVEGHAGYVAQAKDVGEMEAAMKAMREAGNEYLIACARMGIETDAQALDKMGSHIVKGSEGAVGTAVMSLVPEVAPGLGELKSSLKSLRGPGARQIEKMAAEEAEGALTPAAATTDVTPAGPAINASDLPPGRAANDVLPPQEPHSNVVPLFSEPERGGTIAAASGQDFAVDRAGAAAGQRPVAIRSTKTVGSEPRFTKLPRGPEPPPQRIGIKEQPLPEGTRLTSSLKPRTGSLTDEEMLRANMEAAGKPVPEGHDAHHIVAKRGGGRWGDEARMWLRKATISINDADNGMALPGSSVPRGTVPEPGGGPYHGTIHTPDPYYREIATRLRGITDETQARGILNQIERDIIDDKFPHLQPN